MNPAGILGTTIVGSYSVLVPDSGGSQATYAFIATPTPVPEPTPAAALIAGFALLAIVGKIRTHRRPSPSLQAAGRSTSQQPSRPRPLSSL